MTLTEFHSQLDNILELPSGTIKGDEGLENLPAWDSLAVLSFIAMADEKLKVQFSARDIAACTTVADLARLAGDRIS